MGNVFVDYVDFVETDAVLIYECNFIIFNQVAIYDFLLEIINSNFQK